MFDLYDNDFEKAFDEAVDAIEKKEHRLIWADALKRHYAWWKGGTREMTMDEAKNDFDTIIDLQPTAEQDKEIQELRREVERLKAELARAKEIQMRLFRLVPADALALLAREYPEKIL